LALARNDRGADWREAAEKEERKDEHEAGNAFGHEPARQRPEEIADTKIFAPG
jgi:hypothetical protein